MIYDCVVVRSLNKTLIDLGGEFTDSDMTMDDSDDLEERMEGFVAE